MENTPVLIGIVDDHTLFRSGLSGLLDDFKELKVAFEAGNGLELQQQVKLFPETRVVLMDIHMPVMDGYSATAWLHANHPEIRFLALSMFEDDDAVIGMLKAGAGGYVVKESKPRDLLEAILTIEAKGIYLNEMVSGKLYRTITEIAQADPISDREVDFLRLCCSELTYKEMADQMCISPRTIDNYREALFAKLGIKSRTGLVLYAIKHKIFTF
jgi:DNA-binding NarL/FixJ family response regulator